MKKHSLFFFLMLGFTILSCKKVAEEEPKKEEEPAPSPNAVYIRGKAVAAGTMFNITIRPDDILRNLGYTVGSGNNLGSIKQADGGEIYCVALRADSSVWSWGRNTFGQLGDSTNIDRPLPYKIPELSGIVSVSCGLRHTLALKYDGTVWAWGLNSEGQLGDSTFINRDYPIQVTGLTGVIAISAGVDHSIALKSDGTIWSWGDRIGSGSVNNRSKAELQVYGTPGEITAISAGGYYNLFLKNDGTVWGWGYNQFGQLGDPAIGNIYTSTIQVPGISNVTSISAGYTHSLAIKNDSTAWSWGHNLYGGLGNGTKIDFYTPQQIMALSKITAIDAGMYSSIALSDDGKIWTWGWNNADQLGISHTTIMERLTPRAVVE